VLLRNGALSLDLVDPAQFGGPGHQLLAGGRRDEGVGPVGAEVLSSAIQSGMPDSPASLRGRIRCEWLWLSHADAPPKVEAQHRNEAVGGGV